MNSQDFLKFLEEFSTVYEKYHAFEEGLKWAACHTLTDEERKALPEIRWAEQTTKTLMKNMVAERCGLN